MRLLRGGVLILLVSVWTLSSIAQEFKIIAPSSGRVTTHEVNSGDFIIGITDNGGGMVNKVYIPEYGDIMDKATDSYGRGGQTAIRDQGHNGRYNPTQAGFHETLGTKCKVTQSEGKLVIEPRGLALWHGDKGYDYIRWENIGPDPYDEHTKHGGTPNASDEDGLEEENLSVTINDKEYTKQEAEVYSEWDYYGTYEDFKGKRGITIPAIKHYFEFRFIRPPGHCIKQFEPKWNPGKQQNDISRRYPQGVHKGTVKDMNNMIAVWSLRHDRSKWTPKYAHYRKKDNSWGVCLADDGIPGDNDGTVFINADSNDPNTGVALGLFRPKTDINSNTVIGRNEKTGKIVYKDNRGGFGLTYTMARIKTMSKYGFLGVISGMINRTKLEPDVYESFRSEYLIFYGTPQQIMDAVSAYEKSRVTSVSQTLHAPESDFELYPNPVNGNFQIKLEKYQPVFTKIYNVYGTQVYSDFRETDGYSIITSQLGGAGIYFVSINGVTEKLIAR